MSELPAGLAPFDAARAKGAIPLWLIPQDMAALPEGAEQVARITGFSGELGNVLAFDGGVLVGTGDGAEPFALGAAAGKLREGDYAVANLPAGEAGALALLGWGLGAYRFTKYKSQAPVPTLILPEGADTERLMREVAAVTLVRDLVNTPTDDMGPAQLTEAAQGLAARFEASVEVIEGEALKEGFPLVHAVGRAAATPPRLIDLRWGRQGAPAITLVGKGVCFDTGGLNIKGGAGMSLMKKDMGGAANALGLASLIMASGLDMQLRVLIPAVENAIAGNAFRPGDVFRSRNGITVEISNTDAEGRLILADALAYGAEEKPDRIISLATLTGAARTALGPDVAPIYSTDGAFAELAVAAGARVGDPLWPMPFWARYEEFLNSQIADVNHAARTGFAGSITAALFLKKFVPEEIPYTHLDIFAWVPSARPGRPQGGEATGIRALYEAFAKD